MSAPQAAVAPDVQGDRARRSVAVIDIDGCVADMSPFRHELEQLDVPRGERWRRFLINAKRAELIPAGFDLAWALHHLGYQVAWSTTRPFWLLADTKSWLRQHQLPSPTSLLLRDRGPESGRPAVQVKLRHCTHHTDAGGGALAVFVDDEPSIVTDLAAQGVPARLITDLTSLSTSALPAALHCTTTAG